MSKEWGFILPMQLKRDNSNLQQENPTSLCIEMKEAEMERQTFSSLLFLFLMILCNLHTKDAIEGYKLNIPKAGAYEKHPFGQKSLRRHAVCIT